MAIRKISLLILLLALALVGVWILSSRPTKVAVAKPVRGPAVRAVFATGTVEAAVMLPIATKLPGRLNRLLADELDLVEAGQLLAQLDDSDLQPRLKEFKIQAEFLKGELNRIKALVADGAVPDQEADKALADWQRAVAAVEQISAEIDQFKLYSPGPGQIIRRDGEIGENIPANQPVYWIAVGDKLRVTTEVDEEDIALVSPGQKTLIRADAFPDRVFSGSVESITPKGDPIARSYRVRVALDSNSELKIGMTAETNIIVREVQDALLVPASSVINNEVWVATDSGMEKRSVTVGAKSPEAVEILTGVKNGELIILDGSTAPQDSDFIPVEREWSHR